MASCGKGLSEMEKLSGPRGCQVFPASIALMRRMNGVDGGWRVEGRVRDNEFFRRAAIPSALGLWVHPVTQWTSASPFFSMKGSNPSVT